MGLDVLVMGKGASALLLEVDEAARSTSLLGDDVAADELRVVRIRPRLFSTQYFATIYEDEQYVALALIPSDQEAGGSAGCRPAGAGSP
jgi:hypothetical protein